MNSAITNSTSGIVGNNGCVDENGRAEDALADGAEDAWRGRGAEDALADGSEDALADGAEAALADGAEDALADGAGSSKFDAIRSLMVGFWRDGCKVQFSRFLTKGSNL